MGQINQTFSDPRQLRLLFKRQTVCDTPYNWQSQTAAQQWTRHDDRCIICGARQCYRYRLNRERHSCAFQGKLIQLLLPETLGFGSNGTLNSTGLCNDTGRCNRLAVQIKTVPQDENGDPGLCLNSSGTDSTTLYGNLFREQNSSRASCTYSSVRIFTSIEVSGN